MDYRLFPVGFKVGDVPTEGSASPEPPSIMNESEMIPAAEWASFYNDESLWNGLYIEEDDDTSYVEQQFTTDADAMSPRDPVAFVEFARLDGSLGWQGTGPEPADMPTTTLELYHRWKTQGRKALSIVVEVPSAHAPDLIKAVATVQGARILNPPDEVEAA